MQIISSNAISAKVSNEESLWIYNGLDCAVTLLAWQRMQKQRSANSDISYNFVSGMRAPSLEMSMRGMLVDLEQRAKLISAFEKKKSRLKHILDSFAKAVWDAPLNHASPAKLKAFFYDTMQMPVQYKFDKGQRKVSTNREALEKITMFFHAAPIARTCLALRDVEKKLQFLRTGIDSDNRFRSSFNVVGTETGRWSSSSSAYDTGSNQQNIEDELRKILRSDPGYKLAYVDKDQAESRAVAYISGDMNYINACESGDLHTTVCRMIWPNLPWTGILAQDKKVAETPFYRQFSYRDMAKRGGHGTNYYGTPRTMAMHLKLKEAIMSEFQEKYFDAFPGIRRWHNRVAMQLQTQGYIVTALGRKRNFLGRRFTDETLREGIAFEPQSIVGELLNLFLHRVWKANIVQVLAQVHDAILFQYPVEREAELIQKVLTLGKTEVSFPVGKMIIPVSAQVGWNWAKYKLDKNPYGIKNYDGTDERTAPIYKEFLDWEIC